MHDQGIALWRWLTWHRYQFAVTTALVCAAAVLLSVAPVLLTIGALEWKVGHRRVLGLALLRLLARSFVWLCQELQGIPHGRWHPCAQCAAPIDAPSRALYCSPHCRRYARLEQEAHAPDPWVSERAAVRLRVLRQPTMDPASSEIPF